MKERFNTLLYNFESEINQKLEDSNETKEKKEKEGDSPTKSFLHQEFFPKDPYSDCLYY